MKVNKWLKGGLAAVMALSLAACSNSGTAAGGGDKGGSSKGGTIKIGGSGPLTGDAAVYGTAVKNAAEIAIEEVNKKGGLQYELKMEDDKADGEQAVTAYNNMVDWGMQVSLETVTSGAGQAASPLYQQDHIFGLTPSASNPNVVYSDGVKMTGAYGNIFQMCFSDPNQGIASAEYLKKHTDLGSKVGIIWRNDDNYSTGLHDKFVAKAKELGLEVVEDQTFTNGATDFSVQVKKVKDAGADIVFMPIYYQPASLILQEAKKEGYAPTFFGCDGMDGILTQDGFDASLAEGLYMLTPFAADSTDEKTAAFVKAYKDKYGEVPNQFAADAYDCVYAIAQACDKAGVTGDMKADEICDKLVSEFTTMKFDGVTGSNVTWSKEGEVTKGPRAVVIKGGAYVSAE